MPNNTARKPASDDSSSENRKDYIVWDTEVPGLGRRIRPTRSVWLYQRRIAGKTVRKTLGDCALVDVAQARQLALELSGNETPPAAVIRAAERAKAHKEWLILMFHYLVDDPDNSLEYSVANFEKLIEGVAKSGVRVMPLTQVWAACGRDFNGPTPSPTCDFGSGAAAPRP